MSHALLAILSVLLALPPCWQDRAEPDRGIRLSRIAVAVHGVSQSVDVRARLIAIGWYESRLCRTVHAGSKRGAHGAAGLWQIEHGSRRPGPYAGLSDAETAAAALTAAWLLEHAYVCGPTDADVLTAYAGAPCGSSWPTLVERVRLVQWVRHRLTRVPSPAAIRDALDAVCERDGCTPELYAAAVDDFANEAPGSFAGLTPMQAAESLVEGQRGEHPP